MTSDVTEIEAEMRLAIKAWVNCDPKKRPSAKALGFRIEQIADKLAVSPHPMTHQEICERQQYPNAKPQ